MSAPTFETLLDAANRAQHAGDPLLAAALMRQLRRQVEVEASTPARNVVGVDAPCTIACERAPVCTTCHLTKAPIGRDTFGRDMCTYDCPAYRSEPTPGHLWPGELARERDASSEDVS